MALPAVTVTIRDFNLGLVPASNFSAHAKVGTCSAGPLNTLTYVSAKKDLVETFVSGKTVDSAALCLSTPDHGPFYLCRCAASNAGSIGAVAKTDPAGAVGTPVDIGAAAAGVRYIANQAGVTAQQTNPGAVTAQTTVAVNAKAINVTLRHDGTNILATADEVRAAVAASVLAMALLASVANTQAPGNGTAVAAAATVLPFGSTGTVTPSGTPLDSFEVQAKISRAGAPGTAAFRYSLDGDSFSAETAVPGNGVFVLPGTGVTLTFANTFAVDDLYAFNTVGPSETIGDVTAALDAMLLDAKQWGYCHILAIANAALFAAVATYAAAFEAKKKYVWFILEARDQNAGETVSTWANALIADFANSASIRIAVVGGSGEVFIPLNTPTPGRIQRRSTSWTMAARRSGIRLAEDLGDVRRGPLLGLTKLYQIDQVAALDAARFSVVYTVEGYQGFYGQGRLMSPAGSDFVYWQDIALICEAQRVLHVGLVRYLNTTVKVRKKAGGPQNIYPAGSIDEGAKSAIEAELVAQLHEALVVTGNATAVRVVIDPSVNIVTQKKLVCTAFVTPLGYLKELSGEVALENPKLALK